MSDFTQGPFSVAETRHKYDIVIRGPKNEPIALVLIAGFSKKEGAANAHLIAAAPDLLEALQNIAEYWNQDQNEAAMADACWHAIHTASAAIAKATGDQQ